MPGRTDQRDLVSARRRDAVSEITRGNVDEVTGHHPVGGELAARDR
jgi:hypothetical protein